MGKPRFSLPIDRQKVAIGVTITALFFVALWGGAFISDSVFYGLPHVEDEHAFLFQAKALASGELFVASPLYPEFFPTQFVIDHDGKRFGKYPPGYPIVLSLGVLAGQPRLVNPLLGALGLVLVFFIGKVLYGSSTGLLAAALGLVSPFFLLISGSYMSHSASLLFLTLFVLFFIKSTRSSGIVFPLLAGVCLGLAFITRQLTALGIALPFILYGLLDLSGVSARLAARFRINAVGAGFKPAPTKTNQSIATNLPDAPFSSAKRSILRYGLMALSFSVFAAFLLFYNNLLAGNPFLNPYELWWPFDKVGFGPREELGKTLEARWIGTQINLRLLTDYLFGWPAHLSLAFVAVPFVMLTRRLWDWLLLGAAVSLMAAYMAYWTSGEMYGPRYFFEALPMLFILSARGMVEARRATAWIIGRLLSSFKVEVPQLVATAAVGGLVAFLIMVGFRSYLSQEMVRFKGWYDITSGPLDAVKKAKLDHALVFVSSQRSWTEFAALDVANSPHYDSNVVFAADQGPGNWKLIALYPGREYYKMVGDRIEPYVPPQ